MSHNDDFQPNALSAKDGDPTEGLHNVEAQPAQVVEAQPELELPLFVRAQMPSIMAGFGAPVYFVTDKDAIAAIDAIETEPIYYVVGVIEEEERRLTTGSTNTTTTVKVKKPTVLRRVRNSLGSSLSKAIADNTPPNLALIPTGVNFTLPRLPRDYVDKIDHFFFEVDKKNHSEAIAILTFDKSYLGTENPGDGWGVLIPKQSNTGGSCDYEPTSVMAEKPDGVDIVGTWHSHPRMSAYASHTDEKDQFGNDGLHITTGWQGNRIEHYIEVQMGGHRWTYKEEDLFEPGTPKDFDVADWVAKCETKAFTPNHRSQTYSGGSGGAGYKSGSGSGYATNRYPFERNYALFFREKHNANRPAGCPDLIEQLVITRLLPDENNCPVCNCEIEAMALAVRRCIGCFTYFLTAEDQEVKAILTEREKAFGKHSLFVPGLEPLINGSNFVPEIGVVLWERVTEGDTVVDKITSIIEGPKKESKDPKALTAPAQDPSTKTPTP